ncbi:MAG: aryl-sulfate sulfotransferase, partial [Myxococcales bacterium]|nr:aryl-sulfate sulfotransferase [Myxococcales bacterium]
LLFDNGMLGEREWSRAMEIELNHEQGTAEVVWEYRPDPDIYARIWGDADRLPNGNTLITFGLREEEREVTHLIEVTPGGERAWEVRYPLKWGSYRAERLAETPFGYVIPATRTNPYEFPAN